MLIALLASLQERRREMAILRALGTRPWQILVLLCVEAGLLSMAGVVLGWGAVVLATVGLGPWVQSQWGISLHVQAPTAVEWGQAAAVFLGGAAMGVIPGLRALKNSLTDGLSIRV